MRKAAFVVLSALVLAIGPVTAAESADLFPANVNDAWSIERFGETPSRVHVSGETRTGWKRLDGLFDTGLWVYPQASRVLVWDEAAGASRLLYDFDAEPGAEWAVGFDTPAGRVSGRVYVVERGASIPTAFGPKTGCTTFAFQWDGMGDMGIASQVFCPGLGLVKQERATFVGADPEYAVANTVRGVITTGYLGQGMNIRLEHAVATRGTEIKVRLELWDTTGSRRLFRSATTQVFDLKLVDPRGRVVRLWSSDQFFAQTATSWRLEGEHTFEATLPLVHLDGRALAPGLYTVQGFVLDERDRPAAATQIVVN